MTGTRASDVSPAGRHEVILASAGTGKTYQLTNRYLALLADGVRPGAILATTFTRKAAGEILDRLLQRLAAAAASEEERTKLGEALADVGWRPDGPGAAGAEAAGAGTGGARPGGAASLGAGRGGDPTGAAAADDAGSAPASTGQLQLGFEAAAPAADSAATQRSLPGAAAQPSGAGVAAPSSDVVRLELTAEGCTRLLAEVVRHIDRVQVRTLDAWFLQLAKAFELELGLPPGWSIAEEFDEDELRLAGVSRLLETADTDQIVELLRGLRQDESIGRSTHGALVRLVDSAYDLYLECLPGAWEAYHAPEPLDDAECAHAAAALEALPLPTTKKGDVRKHWLNSRDRALAALARGSWSDVPRIGVVKKLLECEDRFDREPITEEVIDAYTPLIRQAAHHLLSGLVRRTHTHGAALRRYDAASRALRRERRLFGFNDLPRELALFGVSDEATAFRLDGRLDHLLLDEFQDTALPQWKVLEPLAERILRDRSGATSFFCVGDLKQSIYGWRGGEPELLAGLTGRYDGISESSLEASWRSSEVVLDTVNQVFGDLASRPVLCDKPERAAAARTWGGGFLAHEARRDLPGAATLYEVATDPDDDAAGRERRVVEATAVHVAALARSAPAATIGVLVRRNRPIARLLYELRRQGLRASGEGGNPLTDSDAVQIALSLLHLADHPGDEIAFFHVATSGLGAFLGVVFEREQRGPGARRLARSVRRELLARGYGPFLVWLQQGWVATDATFDAWDRRRFAQLVDLAFAQDARPTLRPARFVRLVRATNVEDPTSGRVKVMTVHAAKGLEFDAVVAADLDGEAFGASRRDRSSILAGRADPWAGVDQVVVGAGSELRNLDSTLVALHEESLRRRVHEDLCVLYVALTRAIRRLDMVVAAPGRGKAPRTYATLLRDALQPRDVDGGEPGTLSIVWEHERNTTDWHRGLEGSGDAAVAAPGSAPGVAATDAAAEAAADERVAPLVLAPLGGARPRAHRAPSASGAPKDVAALLRLGGRAARERGSIVHRWFQDIEWLDDWETSDAELLAQAAELTPADVDPAALLAEFRELLAADGVRSALERPADGETRTVWRERSFLVRLPDDGSLLRGAFDRVVLTGAAGAPTAAEIIDFKTGAQDDAEAVARYGPQMQAYAAALAALTGLAPSAITLRLLLADEGRVVSL